MKPAWDELMESVNTPEFNKNAIVGDVDCTVEKEICSTHGVSGYPTIKYGSLADLQDYQGGRDIDALKEFASSNLGPSCGPDNLDLCSDEQKAEIEKVAKMSDDELASAIAEKDAAMEKAESDFKTAVEGLQASYEKLQKDKDAAVAEVKSSGLGVLKQVKASRAAGGGVDKEDL